MRTPLLPLFLLLIAFLCPALAEKAAPSADYESIIKLTIKDFEAKNYDAALEKLKKLDASQPGNTVVLNLLGAVYIKKNDHAAAKASFEKALAKDPGFFPAKFNLGEILFLEKKYKEASDYFELMLAAAPSNELLQFKCFLCKLLMNDNEAALKILKRIKYPSDTPAWYYGQAAWEFKQGHKAKCVEYVKGAQYVFGAKSALYDEMFTDIGYPLK